MRKIAARPAPSRTPRPNSMGPIRGVLRDRDDRLMISAAGIADGEGVRYRAAHLGRSAQRAQRANRRLRHGRRSNVGQMARKGSLLTLIMAVACVAQGITA